FQQYSRAGRFNGAYDPLEYDVLRAGHVAMSSLAYLLAVQAVVRGDRAVPEELAPPQHDEASAWFRALAERGPELRARLGVPADAAPGVRREAVAFDDAVLEDDAPPPKIAFRWRSHRGGIGLVAGAVLGLGIAVAGVARSAIPAVALGAAVCGHVIGRRVRVRRCTACASIVPEGAPICPSCGAELRGDIAHLSDRLEAEERLDDHTRG
ncbi:MAG TPA: hypothetical protein VLX92_15625, partial [Kofleriaceae bacterium]|nr:hypothetical protein [Kofleriaceae bacterium]